MGLFTARGPPDWHPASANVKTIAKNVVDLATNMGKSVEELSLSYSMHCLKNNSIASTLVSMPNEDILQKNLTAATTTIAKAELHFYEKVTKMFSESESSPKCHWEGVELAEYRKFDCSRIK